jgi:thiol:disulfide interchange protein
MYQFSLGFYLTLAGFVLLAVPWWLSKDKYNNPLQTLVLWGVILITMASSNGNSALDTDPFFFGITNFVLIFFLILICGHDFGPLAFRVKRKIIYNLYAALSVITSFTMIVWRIMIIINFIRQYWRIT